MIKIKFPGDADFTGIKNAVPKASSAVVNACGKWYITNKTVDLSMEK